MDSTALRRHNLALVCRALRDHGPTTRPQLARLTGLTKAGVGKIVDELMDRKLVRDLGARGTPRVGRPPSLLEIDGAAAACVGIELNRFHVAALVTDLSGRELFRARRAVDGGRGLEKMLESAGGLLTPAMTAAREASRTIGRVVVGAPGFVNPDLGVVVESPALGWHDVALRGALAEMIGCPPTLVDVDSVGSLAMLAEGQLPQYRDVSGLVRIEAGVSIGSQHFLAGQVQRGVIGSAGAIGHCVVDIDGPVCACGRTGCLDALAGLPALVRAAAPDLAGSHLDNTTDRVTELARRAADGDSRVISAIATAGTWIGIGAATLINVLDPEVLVLGGYVTVLAPWMLESIEAEADARVSAPNRAGCRIEVSTLGRDGPVLGATLSGRERIFDDPTRLENG